MTTPYTPEQAVRALQRIAKRWPEGIGLFSWSGTLCVVRLDDAEDGGGWPHGHFSDNVIETITGIPNDGGDPDSV
jgi:hypothetical protein